MCKNANAHIFKPDCVSTKRLLIKTTLHTPTGHLVWSWASSKTDEHDLKDVHSLHSNPRVVACDLPQRSQHFGVKNSANLLPTPSTVFVVLTYGLHPVCLIKKVIISPRRAPMFPTRTLVLGSSIGSALFTVRGKTERRLPRLLMDVLIGQQLTLDPTTTKPRFQTTTPSTVAWVL